MSISKTEFLFTQSSVGGSETMWHGSLGVSQGRKGGLWEWKSPAGQFPCSLEVADTSGFSVWCSDVYTGAKSTFPSRPSQSTQGF